MKLINVKWFAIIGPSASGRSNLLYVVNWIDKLTAGKVDYFGKEIDTFTINKISDFKT